MSKQTPHLPGATPMTVPVTDSEPDPFPIAGGTQAGVRVHNPLRIVKILGV